MACLSNSALLKSIFHGSPQSRSPWVKGHGSPWFSNTYPFCKSSKVDNYPETSEEQKQVFQKANWGRKEDSMCNNVSNVVFMVIPIHFQFFSNLTFNNVEYTGKHLLVTSSSLVLYLLRDVLTIVTFILCVPVCAQRDMSLNIRESGHRHTVS